MLGRAIYHLAQRRGFLSNRKAQAKDEEEEGKVKEGISELAKKIEESGSRTLGEYFSKLDPEEERIRGRWTSRQMYKDELAKILSAQRKYYPDILTQDSRQHCSTLSFINALSRSNLTLLENANWKTSKTV